MMKIKKIGHCCLIVSLGEVTVLTDPGAFSSDQNSVTGISVVLITHEHADHLHVESLKQILSNNPSAKVFTNSGVGRILADAGIAFELLEDGMSATHADVTFEAFNGKHAEIYEEVGQVQNTAYLINSEFFYPGDSFCNPERAISVLALPVAGPWCKTPDAIRYALSLKPKSAFPVHDGMLQTERVGGYHKIPEKVLTDHGIHFVLMSPGDEADF